MWHESNVTLVAHAATTSAHCAEKQPDWAWGRREGSWDTLSNACLVSESLSKGTFLWVWSPGVAIMAPTGMAPPTPTFGPDWSDSPASSASSSMAIAYTVACSIRQQNGLCTASYAAGTNCILTVYPLTQMSPLQHECACGKLLHCQENMLAAAVQHVPCVLTQEHGPPCLSTRKAVTADL